MTPIHFPFPTIVYLLIGHNLQEWRGGGVSVLSFWDPVLGGYTSVQSEIDLVPGTKGRVVLFEKSINFT